MANLHPDSEKAAALISARTGAQPVDFAIVFGMGMGAFAEHLADAVSLPFSELPGFPNVEGERPGSITIGRIGAARVAAIDGRAGFVEGGDASATRCVFETIRLLGASGAVVTGAVGSTRQELRAGAVVTIRDHINFSGANPLRNAALPDRHVDLSRCYDLQLRERFHVAAAEVGRKVPEAVHFLMAGPAFETPAEVAAARILGGDVIGMSIVPEVVLGRHLGLRMLAVAIVTNHAAELNPEPITSEQIARVAGATMPALSRILVRFGEIWRLSSTTPG